VPPKAPEKIPLGTCQKRGGTPTTKDVCEQPTYQQETPPQMSISTKVCCEVRTGYYEMTEKNMCKRALDESYCAPKLTTIAKPLTQVATIARPLYMK
jgi:hypothetical protein